jgi:hypothetical protein
MAARRRIKATDARRRGSMPLSAALSDSKRAVRLLHWAWCRYWLRRNFNNNKDNWRLLTISGPAPAEEITCIRQLMKRADITSVDIEKEFVELARQAGADEAVVCDLDDLRKVEADSDKHMPQSQFMGAKFDAICLDLTIPAQAKLTRIVKAYMDYSLKKQGVLIITFSYGRDVRERIDAGWERQVAKNYLNNPAQHLREITNEKIAARIWQLLKSQCLRINSCLEYRGHQTPMASCLLVKYDPKDIPPPATYLKLEKTDYQLLLDDTDKESLQLCPRDRVLKARAVRDKRAAAKAVATKQRMKEDGKK